MISRTNCGIHKLRNLYWKVFLKVGFVICYHFDLLYRACFIYSKLISITLISSYCSSLPGHLCKYVFDFCFLIWMALLVDISLCYKSEPYICVTATPFAIFQDIFEKVMFSHKFESAKFRIHEIRAKLLCFILIH